MGSYDQKRNDFILAAQAEKPERIRTVQPDAAKRYGGSAPDDTVAIKNIDTVILNQNRAVEVISWNAEPPYWEVKRPSSANVKGYDILISTSDLDSQATGKAKTTNQWRFAPVISGSIGVGNRCHPNTFGQFVVNPVGDFVMVTGTQVAYLPITYDAEGEVTARNSSFFEVSCEGNSYNVYPKFYGAGTEDLDFCVPLIEVGDVIPFYWSESDSKYYCRLPFIVTFTCINASTTG